MLNAQRYFIYRTVYFFNENKATALCGIQPGNPKSEIMEEKKLIVATISKKKKTNITLYEYKKKYTSAIFFPMYF